jgi:hypothetical protein
MQAPIRVDASHTALHLDSVWMMLSQGESGKEGEENIPPAPSVYDPALMRK